MIAKITGFLRGVVSSVLLITNTLLWFVPIFLLAVLRVLLPLEPAQRVIAGALVRCAEGWVSINGLLLDSMLDLNWEIDGVEELSREDWYLVTANHQTWVDIPVLQYVFNRRIPFLKFFIKKQLMWVPMLGIAWWALDMPFMQRHTREEIAARPELKDRDLETTRRACEKFSRQPTSVINFLEGTRFTAEKHAARGSVFTHLLPPRAGGIAFAIEVLGERFRSLLDVTIVYPDATPSFWMLLSGKLRRIVVHVRRVEIPRDLLRGGYLHDPAFRARFQAWVTSLWQEKDERIRELVA